MRYLGTCHTCSGPGMESSGRGATGSTGARCARESTASRAGGRPEGPLTKSVPRYMLDKGWRCPRAPEPLNSFSSESRGRSQCSGLCTEHPRGAESQPHHPAPCPGSSRCFCPGFAFSRSSAGRMESLCPGAGWPLTPVHPRGSSCSPVRRTDAGHSPFLLNSPRGPGDDPCVEGSSRVL